MSFQNFGKTLYKMRKEKNLTQEELAEKLNVSSKTISKWETGSTVPDIAMLNEIAKYFKISFHDLLDLCLSEESSIESEINLRMKKYTRAVKKKMIFITLLIASIYSGIYYCLKLYYTPHVYALTSDSDYLLIDGTYLDSPVGSKVVINSLYYSDEFTNTDNELKLNSYKIYVYDENDNLLSQGERINDKPRKINDMLMNENLVFDKRLKSNNIFDHHFKVLAIVIEYGEKETNQISCLVKVFDD